MKNEEYILVYVFFIRSEATILHSSFIILLPSPFGEGLGVRLSFFIYYLVISLMDSSTLSRVVVRRERELVLLSGLAEVRETSFFPT